MLIDGHGLAFRAFHAVPALNSRDGTPTNVIMGFMNMLERLEREHKRTIERQCRPALSSNDAMAANTLPPSELSGANDSLIVQKTLHAPANTVVTILKTSRKAEKDSGKKINSHQLSLFDEEPSEPASLGDTEKAACETVRSENSQSEISDVTIVFDAPGKTFRHEIYPEYKQTRKPTPPEFIPQIPLLIELLQYLGYPVVMIKGVEADDTIASASRIFNSVVVTSDKDLLQILRPGVEILRPIKGVSAFSHYDVATFTEEYGFPPESMPDYLALLGDTVDNLPGVPGIGEKTASQLISEYKTIEALFENIEKLKPSNKKNLNENREQVYATRELNRLKFDVKLDLNLFQPIVPDYAAAMSLCEKLDLRQICNRIAILQQRRQ